MQVHPLVPVKKAASLLGMEKGALRQRLEAGELAGEVRRVGDKDRWFVYAGQVEQLLAEQSLPQLMQRAERLSTEGLNQFFEEEEPTPVKTTTKSYGKTPTGFSAKTATKFYAKSPSTKKTEKIEVAEPATKALFVELVNEFAEYMKAESAMMARLKQELVSERKHASDLRVLMIAYRDRLSQVSEQMSYEQAAVQSLYTIINEQSDQLIWMEHLQRLLEVSRIKLESASKEARAVQRRADEERLSNASLEAEIRCLQMTMDSMQTELEARRRPWWQRLNSWLLGSTK